MTKTEFDKCAEAIQRYIQICRIAVGLDDAMSGVNEFMDILRGKGKSKQSKAHA